MSIVNVDTSNPELLKKPEYPPIPAGIYDFEVGNDLHLEKAKSSDNQIVKVELMCQDEGEHKGSKVFDTLTLTENAKWKIAQFAKSCGLESEDGNLDLADFKGLVCKASVSQKVYTKATGAKQLKNVVEEYLFDAS